MMTWVSTRGVLGAVSSKPYGIRGSLREALRSPPYGSPHVGPHDGFPDQGAVSVNW